MSFKEITYKIRLYYNTIKYLREIQIFYRIIYFIKSKIRKIFNLTYCLELEAAAHQVIFIDSILSNETYKGNSFVFLNKCKKFDQKIDWNYSEYGLLWLYNLNYFEYLGQKNIVKSEGVRLVNDFVLSLDSYFSGLASYPTSLRVINWIKFFVKHNISSAKINNSLYSQCVILKKNIEYQFLGNHLLENGFALLFAGYFFRNEIFYKKAKNILIHELNEQILSDGAHFELSPMYHQIMLFRILDCINLIKHNPWKKNELLDFLILKAVKMLKWLDSITFSNGKVPLVNDSEPNIAPSTKQLIDYALRLELKNWEKTDHNYKLDVCGYRMIKSRAYELFMDLGNIGPDYLTAHSHSDTLNFLLNIGNRPFIVDTGISTYEKNWQRLLERSTASHNTVLINGMEQSEIWSGFRVANRAKISIIYETEKSVSASHNGYKKFGILHNRTFEFEKEYIAIVDSVISNKELNIRSKAFLHFHPEVDFELNENTIYYENMSISFKNALYINVDNYYYAEGYNKTKKAKVIIIEFCEKLETLIEMNK